MPWLTPGRERVRVELAQLEEKIVELRTFMHSPCYTDLISHPHRILLAQHLDAMESYAEVLQIRAALT